MPRLEEPRARWFDWILLGCSMVGLTALFQEPVIAVVVTAILTLEMS